MNFSLYRQRSRGRGRGAALATDCKKYSLHPPKSVYNFLQIEVPGIQTDLAVIWTGLSVSRQVRPLYNDIFHKR